MIKKRLVQWAFDAALEYLEENGEKLAVEAYGKIIVWLKSLIESFDEDATEQVFGAPAPVEGAEDWCSTKFAEFQSLAA